MGAIRMSALSYREETPLVKVGTRLANLGRNENRDLLVSLHRSVSSTSGYNRTDLLPL